MYALNIDLKTTINTLDIFGDSDEAGEVLLGESKNFAIALLALSSSMQKRKITLEEPYTHMLIFRT